MKKNVFKKLLLTLLIAGTFALTACSKKSEISGGIKSAKKDAQDSGKITVGFSIDTLAMERWQRDLDVFMNTVNELGANIIVQNAGNNLDEQKRQIHYLGEKGIDVLDLRARIREENLRHHELFYRTDHHWLTTTGIWAAKEILDYCNTRYHFQAETERLLPEQFVQKVYPEWFLGSQGKKVTLARTEPDDFTLLYPKYPTLFHFIVPAAGVDETSDYSVVYDMTEITVKDYYGKNPYSGCGYGEQPLVRIQNLENADNRRVLVLRDSFGDCLIPGLALCEREIDALDLRLFSGSVISYVEQNKPDLVVVLYSAASIGGAVNYHSHRDMFDFR